MITIEDCQAFCDADSGLVEKLACRECLPLMLAYARAHETTRCANDFLMAPAPQTPPSRLAA